MDRHHPIPLYYQLAEHIKEQIRSGELRQGEQLPAERHLGETFGISRMTVRQAIASLVREGLLVARPGVGTFVAKPKLIYDALHLLGFTEAIAPQDSEVTSEVLEQIMVTPPPAVAQELELQGKALKLVRLRKVRGVPLVLETNFIPDICPGLEDEDFSKRSLYALLETRCGLHLERARQTFEVTVASDYEAALFGIKKGAGMILLEGVTYTDKNRPVEYFRAVYRGDRFKVTIESRRNDPLHTPTFSLTLLDERSPYAPAG